jgi:hypothetical protein
MLEEMKEEVNYDDDDDATSLMTNADGVLVRFFP